MKKLYVFLFVMAIMAFMTGCGSTPVASSNVPAWLSELPPPSEFWGIGYVKLQNESLARDAAIAAARRDVAGQLSALVQSMLTDYARESGTLNNTASIQSIERVSQDLINANLTGAVPNAQTRMSDGTWWIRVSYPKAAAQKAVDDVFSTEASRYADFKAGEASRMMHQRIAETQSTPTPRSQE